MFLKTIKISVIVLIGMAHVAFAQTDFSPKQDEQQLTYSMHSQMSELPHISVGLQDADLNGSDNRVLQAAVDYIAGLGGGIVEIGEGEFTMNDSLHLRPNVVIKGQGKKTILRKSKGSISNLGLDGDFGEEQVTLVNPDGFDVGYGIAVWDKNAGGFHSTVARITGKNGNTVSISKPLMSDCMVRNNAQAATVFPVISGYDLEGVVIEGITIEGNKEENPHLNGCRGAGIFLYRGFGTEIRNCIVRNYNGDGISFQQSNDVKVENCISEDNTQLGLHPGSGSQRPIIQNCIARRNGTDGLFLCWRVRHGIFNDNQLLENGRFGISIGHKDSDNILVKNIVKANSRDGIFFRNESLGMAPHRNKLAENIIENNGTGGEGSGIRIRGEVNGLEIVNNIIRDTRNEPDQTQKVGILIEETVGDILIESNQIETKTKITDQRKSSNEEK
jgi:hypothetical protein